MPFVLPRRKGSARDPEIRKKNLVLCRKCGLVYVSQKIETPEKTIIQIIFPEISIPWSFFLESLSPKFLLPKTSQKNATRGVKYLAF